MPYLESSFFSMMKSALLFESLCRSFEDSQSKGSLWLSKPCQIFGLWNFIATLLGVASTEEVLETTNVAKVLTECRINRSRSRSRTKTPLWS